MGFFWLMGAFASVGNVGLAAWAHNWHAMFGWLVAAIGQLAAWEKSNG